jgi:uncharacterized lipoprotein YddW (UPF0748 family)
MPQPNMRAHRMPLLLAIWATVLLLTPFCAAQKLPSPPVPTAEFRGAWIATVGNIDWPSKKGLPTERAQQELAAIVDAASAMQLNALVFQVRPCADALYQSQIEPWSEFLTGKQGQAPQPFWDPLQFLIERAHANGIEVHAWFNPYRTRSAGSNKQSAPSHVTQKQPSLCVDYGDLGWMDPGNPRSSEWSLSVIADVVRRYDLDGVHFDDYFYPYPKDKLPFPDEGSYRRYLKSGGQKKKDDWRRDNVDTLVERLADDTHRQKPFCKVGISPFGIARPGVPSGIEAGVDQYAHLHADVRGWLKAGHLDYLAPQLYWPIDKRPQSFATLLPWWNGENKKQRHMWPGLNASEAAKQARPWREDELVQQVEMIRQQSTAPGHIHFSWKAIRPGTVLHHQLTTNAYLEAAPVPASPWLGNAPMPAAPGLRLEVVGTALRAFIDADVNARFYCVQVLRGTRWRTLCIRGRSVGFVDVPQDSRAVAVRGIAKNGLMGAWRGLPAPK